MTTPATGTVSLRPDLGTSVIIPSRITTSIQSLSSLAAAQFVTPASPAPLTVVIDGLVTTYQDTPGFQPLPSKQPALVAQTDAVCSAAANTATAYGLDPVRSSDQARIIQQGLQQQIIRLQPTVVVTQVIIPP